MKILMLLTFMTSSVLYGQFRDQSSQADPRLNLMAAPQGTLFDMSKLSVSHSFTAGYFSSGSHSVMTNEYVAGLKYKISDPLTLRLDLGMSYTPYSSFSLPGEDSTDLYLKSASLDYKPNETFRMRIDFRNVNTSDRYFNRDPFGNSFNDGR